MAKENETGKNNKKVVDPQKKKKGARTPVKTIPVMDDHVHPHYRGMDE